MAPRPQSVWFAAPLAISLAMVTTKTMITKAARERAMSRLRPRRALAKTASSVLGSLTLDPPQGSHARQGLDQQGREQAEEIENGEGEEVAGRAGGVADLVEAAGLGDRVAGLAAGQAHREDEEHRSAAGRGGEVDRAA